MNLKQTENTFIEETTKANIERMYSEIEQLNISVKDPIWVVIRGMVAVVNHAQNDMTQHTHQLKEQMDRSFSTTLADVLNDYKDSLINEKESHLEAEKRLRALDQTINSLNKNLQVIADKVNSQSTEDTGRKNAITKISKSSKKIEIGIAILILLSLLNLVIN